ncbi:hypothetical protein GCM10029964_117190 [Kibdelosporangium lantanae]
MTTILRRRWVVPLGLALLVAVLAQIPALRHGLFYMVDDSAAQFVPMWRRIGEQLLHGTLPLLDVDSWAGGNLAGEALFGLWNPVNLLDYLLVTQIDSLPTAATVVKTQFLVIAAVGVYLLSREYGAARWAAFSLGLALPFSGFILYFQAETWAGGLMTFAWVPYVWWAGRRAARRVAHPVWAFLFGALCVTAGNPYGVLAILVIYAGLIAEFRQWRVALIGLSVLAVAPLVFLPLVGASAVGARNGLQFFNNGELAPNIDDLLTLSVPSQMPGIRGFEAGSLRLKVPGTYLTWFVVPVLAWLDWGLVRRRKRELRAVFVVIGTYLVFCLAPSHIWMFRWPLRNIENLYLGISVLLAVLMSAGLRTDHMRRRVTVTAGGILAGTYLSVASWPKISARHMLGMVLVAGLTALLIWAARRGKSRWQAAVLASGTVVVLLLQTTWSPVNASVTTFYPTPTVHSPYTGTVAQVGAVGDGPTGQPIRGVLFGNGYAAAGVPSLMAYTGIDYVKFTKALCQTHRGTCKEGYEKLFEPVQDGLSIADLAKVQTVVVQRRLLDEPAARPGWHQVHRDDDVTVFARDTPVPFPQGRVSAWSPGLQVDQDTMDGARSERVRFHRPHGPAQLTFARLDWPGYQARVNGHRVPVKENAAGLLVVDLPDGAADGDLELGWTPPGFVAGWVCAFLGLALAIALGWRGAKRPRAAGALLRPRREGPHRTERGRDREVVAG